MATKQDSKAVAAKTMPTGVKVISVLYYIGAAVAVLAGLLLFAGAGFIGTMMKSVPLMGMLGTGLFVVLGIILVGMGVLEFFIGRGLWKGRNWARIAAIILSAIGLLNGLFSLMSFSVVALVGVAIHAAVIWYLGFSQEGKSAFS